MSTTGTGGRCADSRWSATVGALLSVMGGGVLIGWAFGIEWLKRLHPALLSVKPNTALAFLFLGFGLVVFSRRPSHVMVRWAGRILVAAVALIGLITLAEHLTGLNLGIDHLLFSHTPLTDNHLESRRVTAPTALCILLAAVALLLLDAGRAPRVSQTLALLVGLVALWSLCSYLFGVNPLSQTAPGAQMALRTAIGMLLFSSGVLARVPRVGWLATITGDGAGSRMLRRLLPFIVAVPLLMAWVRLFGQYVGWYDLEFGVAMTTFFTIALLALLAVVTARSLNLSDNQRARFREQLAEMNRDLAAQVAAKTADLSALNRSLTAEVAHRRETELLLIQQRNETQSFFDVASVILVVLNPDETVGRINQMGCSVLGWPYFEIVGSNWFDRFVPDQDRTRTRAAFHDIMSGRLEPVERFENNVVTRAGATRLIAWHNAYLRGKDGRIAATVSSGMDVTDQRQAEKEIRKLNVELELRVGERTAELQASNRELESFSYSVSHDLRAPLRHVSGFVELLCQRLGDTVDEKSRGYLATISDAVRQMGQLIDDLLTFSRMGRMEMSLTVCDLRGMVAEVVAATAESEKKRQIDWTIGALPTVRADYAMLRQVFRNLLENAVKYTRTRTQARIEIGARSDGRELVVFVRDNGVGFDMQYSAKLFNVFQRLHRTEEFEGTGIGLANVRRIVHRHGGRTWAEGAVDQGATFYFALPADAAVPAA